MGFYETESGVKAYIEMAKGYDGALLIEELAEYLPPGSTVLELGMGPGVDLDILAQTYEVTGSDSSRLFLDRYRERHPEADLLLLDARTLETERRFDCIYSNKVLHHLSAEELHESLVAQAGLLRPEGIAMHSFWWGDKETEWMEGLRFAYHTETTLASAVSDTGFAVNATERYSEMETDDSILIVLSKSQASAQAQHVRRTGTRSMSTDYVVRLAGPEHLDQLPAIERAAATRFGDSLPRSVLSHVTTVDALVAAQLAGLLWVALEPAGTPVGFAVASAHGRRVHLEELDVLPEHGRKGVGSALVEAVEDYALNSGGMEITLTTFSDVPWNAPFYASAGFEVIPEQELDAQLLRRLSDETELGLDRSRRVAMRKPLSRLNVGHIRGPKT